MAETKIHTIDLRGEDNGNGGNLITHPQTQTDCRAELGLPCEHSECCGYTMTDRLPP